MMELRFLYSRMLYSTLGDRLETEALEQTVSYRGQKYNLCHPLHTSKPQLGLRTDISRCF